MTEILTLVLSSGVGYVVGSIPVGVIVTRLYQKGDLTAVGSGRTGATNVMRAAGFRAAAIVFAGDFLKGAIAYLAAGVIAGDDPWARLAAVMLAMIGHVYSPLIGFKGGRGVTTGIGGTMLAAPASMLVGFVVGTVVILTTRYVSLGSLIGSIVTGLLLVGLAVATGAVVWAAWGVLFGAFVVFTHRDNVRRLWNGSERKVTWRGVK